jgi:hypothetical protein
MSDTLSTLIEEAFAAVVEAEHIAYAGGLPRELKDDLIAAHSALLRAKNRKRLA